MVAVTLQAVGRSHYKAASLQVNYEIIYFIHVKDRWFSLQVYKSIYASIVSEFIYPHVKSPLLCHKDTIKTMINPVTI